MALDLSRFAKAFFEEAQEHILALESLLISLDLHTPDEESLNAIFRAVHSVKGGAAAFGHTALTDFTHSFETLLDRIRKRTLPISKPMVDQFLRAGDLMRAHVTDLEQGRTTDVAPMITMQAALKALGETTGAEPTVVRSLDEVAAPHQYITLALDRDEYANQDSLDALAGNLRGLGAIEGFVSEAISETTLKVSFRLMTEESDGAELRESLEFLVPAESISIAFIAAAPVQSSAFEFFEDDPEGAYEFFEPLESTPVPPPPDSTAAGTSTASLLDSDIALANVSDASSIRVNVHKVDQIINLVGELVIAEAMLSQSSLKLPPEMQQQLATGLAQLERNTRDLQEAVLAIRMMPISFVFSRLPRLTRDLADRLGKEIEIELSGEDTELDKSVIEKLSDPLTHLVRNAIDHGVESPEARALHGKPAVGRVAVRAAHAGGSVLISVSDDGAGLNRERIIEKAHQLGLEGVNEWADDEIWNLIFTPGFSTASAVTDVSGRGVGMDVVWQNVHSLGGKTQITSTPGEGTMITIRLPLTLAILDGMSVLVNGETYIVALANVMQSIQPSADEVQTVSGQQVVMVRDEYVPIISLAELFNIPAIETSASSERAILVVLDVDGLNAALRVDELLGQHQVVLKSLESNYRRVPGISGATILGDGRVAMILDAAYLVSIAHAVKRDAKRHVGVGVRRMGIV